MPTPTKGQLQFHEEIKLRSETKTKQTQFIPLQGWFPSR